MLLQKVFHLISNTSVDQGLKVLEKRDKVNIPMEPFALVLKPFQSYLTTNLKNINLIQILSNYVQKKTRRYLKRRQLKKVLSLHNRVSA